MSDARTRERHNSLERVDTSSLRPYIMNGHVVDPDYGLFCAMAAVREKEKQEEEVGEELLLTSIFTRLVVWAPARSHTST